MPEHFTVTTPIYYVNALPHLGTFYTTVVADALARYHRSRGHDTFFLTGTDEHGQKIERLARERGAEPKAFCDQVAAAFQQTWARMGVSHDRFIRTTDEDHRRAVEDIWRRLDSAGDLYLGDYDGLYCVGCEESKSEDDVIVEGGEKVCAIHRRPVERVKEKNYFFRLSRYAERLLALYDRPGFIRPESRRNEVAEFVKGGLRDISVSRTTVKWGIAVPGHPEHAIYVWIDALTNYLTGLGGPDAVGRDARARTRWLGCHHLIAKDILRFHAVYWPAMLMAAELPPPKSIFCHGYLTVRGQKISKSIPATRVDPGAIADELGADPLRYFVLREYTLGADGDFTYEALFGRYEADLGNDLGNLLNRTVTLARQLGPELEPGAATYSAYDPLSEEGLDLRSEVLSATEVATRAWDDFSPSRALDATWAIIRRGNVHLDRTAPWKLLKAGALPELRQVLSSTCEIIRRAGMMVAPAMPGAAREILRQIGREQDLGRWPEDTWTGWPGGMMGEPRPVFPRVDPDRRDELIGRWMGGDAPAPADRKPARAKPRAATAPGEVSIDDFLKLDLRVARVTAARPLAGSDKLLELTLEVGGETRTVVSGIAGPYGPDSLVGKAVLYLANLKPAKIRGVVSQGMILAAGDEAVLALATLDRDAPSGTRVR